MASILATLFCLIVEDRDKRRLTPFAVAAIYAAAEEADGGIMKAIRKGNTARFCVCTAQYECAA